ncbi:MAG: RHS repeat-associated core domain-containing protein [Candidatus Acidiferrales bacterium]
MASSEGNRTSKTDQLAGVTSNYSYDSIYELTQVNQAANQTESYTYDPVGNRLSSLMAATSSYNASNELTSNSNATYTYDSNGNTTSKTNSSGTTNYTWDFENRLASVALPGTGGTVTFRYDPFGRRIQKVLTQGTSTTTTNYAYDGKNITETTDGSGNVVASYAQGEAIDEPLAIQQSGATTYYHADGLGSITSLTNAGGALAQTYTYDSFGNLVTSTGSVANPFRYTAREFDQETGLYFYRARYYDSWTGKFLSEDPIGFGGGVDFYRYAASNPIRFADPSGLQPGDWWDPRTYRTLPQELNPFNPNGTFYKEANSIWDAAVGTVTGDWKKVGGAYDNNPLGLTAKYANSCDPFNKYVGYYGTRGALAGATVADTLAAILMFNELFHDSLVVSETPPGWNENWEWRYPESEGGSPSSPRWFDENGGEWRWHAPDDWHTDGHWDYNPWTEWNSKWQNIYPPKP